MKDLIERLENLDGPCRECDAEIARKIGAPWGYREDVHLESRSYTIIKCTSKHYTESIDAALTHIPDGMRLARLKYRTFCVNTDTYEAILSNATGEYKSHGNHKLPAIAICIAVLRACQSIIDGER